MPRIAQFEGIAIYIYFNDHLPPHFHAFAGDDEAVINIETLQVEQGRMAPKKLAATLAWARANQDYLRTKWTEITGK